MCNQEKFSRLEIQKPTDALVDPLQQVMRNGAGQGEKVHLVHGSHLRSIGDRVPWKTGEALGQKRVTWRFRKCPIASQHAHHHRGKLAGSCFIALDYERRMAKPGLRTAWLIKFDPPDLSTADHLLL